MAFAFSTPTKPSNEQPLIDFTNVAFDGQDQTFDQGATLTSEGYLGELALLRQKNSQLDQVIDVMPTGMVMLDGNGIVVKVNKIARSLLDEPILGQAWFNVIKRSFKPRADDWHEVSLKDGRRVKLEITALGNQPGQLIMITDLTETRLMQDKLSQLQRLSSLGKMVSTLAHQIRTPLSAAMLYGANLANKKLTTNDRGNFQKKLMSRLRDLEQQVNDMLLFAKSGKQQVVEELSVNELMEESVQSMEEIATQTNGTINLYPCEDNCQILGNKNALTGAIQNLIHNSLQVIKEDAIIDISVMCQKEIVEIHVKDNGDGISQSLTDKIFEPFYTSRLQGTGLGLAVVKSVANAHQGEVKLLSKSGEGAHFCITLPLLLPDDIHSNRQNSTQTMTQETSHEHK